RIAGDEEPVAAPGDIATHRAIARHVDAQVGRVPVASDIVQGNTPVLVQLHPDLAHGGVQVVPAGGDLAQMRQRADDPDGAVPAHAEVADVVEEDHAGACVGALRG